MIELDPAFAGKGRAAGAPDRDEPRTIGAMMREHADRHPQEPALVTSRFGSLSYAGLADQIDGVRKRLRAAGFDRHARLAVALPSGAEATLAVITLASSTAVVPLDPKLTNAELERCLRITRPAGVILMHDGVSTARSAAARLQLPIIEAAFPREGTLRMEMVAPQVGPAAPLDEPDPEAPAFILHTSGTTAEPNLVPFSHRNMLAAAQRVQSWFRLARQDRCLSVSPLHYSHGLTTTVMPALLTGGSIALPANPINVDLAEWFAALSPTWYSAGPTLHLAVVEKAGVRSDARRMHRLRFISSAGAGLPRDLRDTMQEVLGVPVLEHYGSSETAQISANCPPPGPCRPGTCGKPWPDTVMIADSSGRRLPAGIQGEILVRGPTVMSGYLDAPELNRSAFAGGWYRTGDIGMLDADGFLSLKGRLREIINRGSEKIAPLEVDQALMRHPDVAEAAAYAVPHPRLGEDVAAAVVLRAGSTVTPTQLRELVGRELATFKVPRRISIVDKLPKGLTGKIQRNRLRDILKESSMPSDDAWHAQLLGLWKKYLKTDDVSIDDDFFEKGGDSLLALDLQLELQRLTGQELPESILFEASTVRALAKRLSNPAGDSARGGREGIAAVP